MATITFPAQQTEKLAQGFLLGRFSGRVLVSGEQIVPEAALEALAEQNIPFTVKLMESLPESSDDPQVIDASGT